jgi:hypothetical protein
VTAYFRVTVEDLETGDKQAMEVAEGDYALLTFGSCYLDGISVYGNGTVQLNVRDHHPAGPKREVAS